MATTVSVPVARSRGRDGLAAQFRSVISANAQFDRSLVSFQANRNLSFFSWMKYKEAFSARLVEWLIEKFGRRGGLVLDPFAGVGTSLFVARSHGMKATGIELLPVGFSVMMSRLAAEMVDPVSFQRKVRDVAHVRWRDFYDPADALAHISITRGAFPVETERELGGYRAYCRSRIRDVHVRQLFELAGFSVLESISYTRKDGQYLRWDHRAGKPRVKAGFDKGAIASFSQAIASKLQQIASDLRHGEASSSTPLLDNGSARRVGKSLLDVRNGSCLAVLPEMASGTVDLVITSPPYCNRYDYTRTYALELVYLGLGEDEIKSLRQAMLSCTVENRAKVEQLQALYAKLARLRDFDVVNRAFDDSHALHEVLEYLEACGRAGTLNNTNIPRMVCNYFREMAFVVFELARSLRRGGRIVMVNDNVRYVGEEVPVDLILSDFACKFGLHVEQIWTLPRGKGNSSQQMGAHGRSELRKCVYVWQKP